jgi:uncharacterized protein (DUF58 family)
MFGGPKSDPTATEAPALAVEPSVREVLRRLELDVTRRLDGLLHGDHRGLVPGHGTELGETRRYAPGDDVRRIDWNVTARLSEPHIRQTISERELETWLVVDRSARLDFGTADCEKRDLALAAAGAVGFLTNRDGNRIGGILVGRGATDLIPARSGRNHLLRLLHQIASTPRGDHGGVTDLADGLGRLAATSKRRGLAVVISDFEVAPGWEQAMGVLSQRHEVVAMQVSDPRQFDLPDVGLVAVRDPATGAVRDLATNKRSVRQAFADTAHQRQRELEDKLRLHRIDHLHLSTDRPWLDDIVGYISARRTRAAGTTRRGAAPTNAAKLLADAAGSSTERWG